MPYLLVYYYISQMCRENLIILASVKVEFYDELLVFIFEVLP